MSRYCYCGVVLESVWALPCVPEADASRPVDITIAEAPVPEHLPDATRRMPTFDVDLGTVLFRVPRVGRYCIRSAGRQIEVEPAPGAVDSDVVLFLLDPVFAVALAMRGEFVLNAASVVVDGAVLAFSGASGAGKSESVAKYAAAGALVVSDSVLRLSVSGDGAVLAYPQAPWLRLWPDTINRHSLVGRHPLVRSGLGLRRVPFAAAPLPLPLQTIVMLSDGEAVPEAASSGTRRVAALLRNSLAVPWFDGGSSARIRHLSLGAEIARRVAFQWSDPRP